MATSPIFMPRPDQREVLAYTGGRMGVAAVPGSGKTWTLSLLAANLLASGKLHDDQEVLVVTLVNSAVDNFYQRVSGFVKDRGLLPHLGYRVRTLHGLAHDIVRERPDLVGLTDDFQIVDEREADNIREDVASTWLHDHLYALDDYLDSGLDEERRDWVRQERLPDSVNDIALAFIRYAKDYRLTPEQLQQKLDQAPMPLPLAEMGVEIYAGYQRALAYRGAVDFDDLIRLALDALHWDAALLKRLRYRWPYILEDEAQDSSRLQEEILQTLSGPDGNWVRVGDPNQAIYETFTTANPKYLREFTARPGVIRRSLASSGRSTHSIIDLANYLVEWTQNSHPNPALRGALQAPPLIEPTPPGDPQPNPQDHPEEVHLVRRSYSAHEEILAVADSLERWLPEHPRATVAALVPRNQRGFELVDELRRRRIQVVDNLLRSTITTRSSAGILGNLLRYLSDPGSAAKLATVYKIWERRSVSFLEAEPESELADEAPGEVQEKPAEYLTGEAAGEAQEAADAARIARVEQTAELLRQCRQVEDFVWPDAGRDWLEETGLLETGPEIYDRLLEFRRAIQRWQSAAILPVDQALLALSQEVFTSPVELAVAHKLAVLLRRASEANPTWRLPELTEELAVIARNERRFLGFSQDDTGFNPDLYPGKVVVATIHKAKGLEWDRVYLLSANNYDFPSGAERDTFIAEKWFARRSLNLEAEALAQLDALQVGGDRIRYHEGETSQRARDDYAAERLRLLYVGITRARKELVITWNTGRRGEALPAEAFTELQSFWEQLTSGSHD